MYILSISCEIALIWMPQNHTNDMSTLAQIMAWCHQAPSHYLSQCWPRFTSPCGITRPQWVTMKSGGILAPTETLLIVLTNGMAGVPTYIQHWRVWTSCWSYNTRWYHTRSVHAWRVNTLRSEQNAWHFSDKILKCIFLNENVHISIRISLKFSPNGSLDIKHALEFMAWHHTGAKLWAAPI